MRHLERDYRAPVTLPRLRCLEGPAPDVHPADVKALAPLLDEMPRPARQEPADALLEDWGDQPQQAPPKPSRTSWDHHTTVARAQRRRSTAPPTPRLASNTYHWTDAATERARFLWSEKTPMRLIADDLHRTHPSPNGIKPTRNSVIGRLDRCGGRCRTRNRKAKYEALFG